MLFLWENLPNFLINLPNSLIIWIQSFFLIKISIIIYLSSEFDSLWETKEIILVHFYSSSDTLPSPSSLQASDILR